MHCCVSTATLVTRTRQGVRWRLRYLSCYIPVYAFLRSESCRWQGMCNFGPLPPRGWWSVLITTSVNSAPALSIHNAEAACSSQTSVWTFNTAPCQNRVIQYDVCSVCDVDPHLQFSLLVGRNFLDSGYRRFQGFISLLSSCGVVVICITGVQKRRALVHRGDLFVFTVAPHICHVNPSGAWNFVVAPR